MKRFFALLLMFLYMIPAIGVNVSMHYCGGELVSVSHQLSEKKKCLCSPNKMKKGCCEDKQQTFKIDDSQQKAELFSQKFNNAFVFEVKQPLVFQNPIAYKSIDRVNYSIFHPPNLYREPLYLLNSVFRI